MKNASGIPVPTLRLAASQEGPMGWCVGLIPGVCAWGDAFPGGDWDATKQEYIPAFTRNTIPTSPTDYFNADQSTTPGDGVWGWAYHAGANRHYAIWHNALWRRNGGASNAWVFVATAATVCGSTTVLNSNEQTGGSGSYGIRFRMAKFVVDPNNADVLYVGAPGFKPRISRDAGATWTDIPSLPVSSGGGGAAARYTLFAIDASSGTAASGSSATVYFAVQGAGIYRTTDGCASTSLIDNTRTNHTYLGVNPNDGALWGCNYALTTNNGWRWTSGSGFTATVNSGFQLFNMAFKSGDTTKVAGSLGGTLVRSTDGGINWGAGSNQFYPPYLKIINEGRMPLPAVTNARKVSNSIGLSVGDILYNAADDSLYLCEGYDIARVTWTAFFAASFANGALTLRQGNGTGISGLVGQAAFWAPGCDPVMLSQDAKGAPLPRSGNVVRATVPSVSSSNTLGRGYGGDWAPENPLHQVIAASVDSVGVAAGTGNTSNAWKTSAPLPVFPPNYGGSVACAAVGKYCFAGGGNIWPRFTLDGGATYTACTFSGQSQIADGTTNGFGFGNYTVRRQIILADKNPANQGRYWVYNDGSAGNGLRGIWRSDDYGANFSRIHDGSSLPNGAAGYHAMLRQPVWKNDAGAIAAAQHLFWTGGQTGTDVWADSLTQTFMRSLDGGVTWTTLPYCSQVHFFAFGKPLPGASYPILYMFGWAQNASVSRRLGYWKSHNVDGNCDWIYIGDNPLPSQPRSLAASPDDYGLLALGWSGHGNYRADASGRALIGA